MGLERDLHKMVTELEKRVKALEEKNLTPAVPPPGASPQPPKQ